MSRRRGDRRRRRHFVFVTSETTENSHNKAVFSEYYVVTSVTTLVCTIDSEVHMPEIGIRELKTNNSRLMQTVKSERLAIPSPTEESRSPYRKTLVSGRVMEPASAGRRTGPRQNKLDACYAAGLVRPVIFVTVDAPQATFGSTSICTSPSWKWKRKIGQYSPSVKHVHTS